MRSDYFIRVIPRLIGAVILLAATGIAYFRGRKGKKPKR